MTIPQSSRLLGRWMVLLLLAVNTVQGQNTRIEIISTSGSDTVFVGDTVRFELSINTQNEEIFGYALYFTVDAAVLQPILYPNNDGKLQPFIVGNFIPPVSPWANTPDDNDTHGDTLGLVENGIPGFQLDFVHLTGPAVGGVRLGVSGPGTVAYFDLEVVGLPQDLLGRTYITFDEDQFNGRETRYYLKAGDAISSPERFASAPDLELIVVGLAILPEVPDTLILPNSSHTVYLYDHFSSGRYDSTEGIWTYTATSLAGATVTIDTVNNADSLYITALAGTHGILDIALRLDSPDGLFYDTQDIRFTVDFPPVFNVTLPSFSFNEDTQLAYTANVNGGGTIFTDSDDTGTAITMWLEPDSLVHLTYDNVNTVTFFADTNWFGSVSSRLFVRDILGQAADTLLSFTVNGINDLPVINLDGISGDSTLVDTVIIHRSTPLNVDLRSFASDEEDPTLAFSWNNPDPTNLTIADNLGDGVWTLMADSLSPFIEIDVTVTVTDDSSASASDILVVSIRSWPPVLDSLGNLIVLSGPPSPLVIDLDSLVSDNDTPDAVMSWTFAALDFYTGVTDDSVSLTWDSLAQTLTITPDSGYAAIDILRYTVEDDDNNITSDSTRLGIFSSLKPVLLPFPPDTVISNSQTEILDLDDYILDPVDAPADIFWTFSGGTRLQQVSINPLSHLVTVNTNAFFFGNDTITFTARNSADSTASGDLLLRVVPENNGPPVWQELPDVEVVYPDIVDVFTLTSVVADDFTPGDQLIFRSYVRSDADSIILLIDSTTWAVQLAAPRQDLYESWFYFTAEDDLGESAQSDTVKVIVTDFYSPIWDNIPTARFRTDQTYRDTLSKYLSDPDSTNNPITVTVTKRVPSITVSYDNVTTELVITSSAVASDSYLSITATNSHGKSTTYEAHVIVVLHIDLIPPDGEITYFFNPVANHWLDFVVVADSTVDQFRSNYTWKSLPAPLLFLQQDSLPGVQSWRASQEFPEDGAYQLVVTLVDASNNVRELRLGPTTVSLSKAVGSSFLSPDNLLDVSYPALPVRDGRLIVLSEMPWPEQAATDPPAIDHALLRGDLPKKIYSLDTNLPDPLMVTVVYHDPALRDDYHSFYEYFEQTLERVETYALGSGRFQAEVLLGKDIVFGGSGIRAGAAPLPYDHLLLYPNPFNSALTISFMLRAEESGRVRIYNLLGQEVFSTGKRTLAAGVNRFHWTGIAAGGRTVPSGIYFIRLETDRGLLVTKKVTMLK